MAEEKKSGLDRRQRQIQVGAGLEESRYNVEFIDFLRRWGSTILLVIAAAAFAFWGLQRYRESREAKTGVAFGDLDAALNVGAGRDVSPDVLISIAQANTGQGAVPVMARLAAAEQWRMSAMKGTRPGATLNPQTGAPAKEDEITPETRLTFLEKAREQYQEVVNLTTGNKSKATFTLAGLMGLAAVAEVQGKPEEAKGAYKQAEALAEAAHFPEFASLAKSRAETVDKFTAPVALLPESMVMSWEKPPAAPTPAPTVPGSSLLTPLPTDLGIGGPGTVGTPAAPTIDLKPTPTPSPSPAPVPSPGAAPAGTPPASPAPAPAPTPAEPKKDEPKP